MVSDASSSPSWVARQPSAFDIVAGYYPESNPKPGGLRLRPCLVLEVLRSKRTGAIACKVAYGTKNIRFIERKDLDVIVQNNSDLDLIGLAMATRFNLSGKNIIDLPWTPEYFGCWSGKSHPKIGSLTETYIKDFFYVMARRIANNMIDA